MLLSGVQFVFAMTVIVYVCILLFMPRLWWHESTAWWMIHSFNAPVWRRYSRCILLSLGHDISVQLDRWKQSTWILCRWISSCRTTLLTQRLNFFSLFIDNACGHHVIAPIWNEQEALVHECTRLPTVIVTCIQDYARWMPLAYDFYIRYLKMVMTEVDQIDARISNAFSRNVRGFRIVLLWTQDSEWSYVMNRAFVNLWRDATTWSDHFVIICHTTHSVICFTKRCGTNLPTFGFNHGTQDMVYPNEWRIVFKEFTPYLKCDDDYYRHHREAVCCMGMFIPLFT